MLAPKQQFAADLAAPVTFAGVDADAFLDALPEQLDDRTKASLQDRAERGATATTDEPANSLFR